jgi:anti-sigma regulatory factor (Ser/Thr protein kinase)
LPDNGSIQRPPDAGSIVVELSTLAAIRRAVEQWSHRCKLSESRTRDAVLAANELATNVIRHGGGTGRLWLWCRGRTLCCQVTDNGPGLVDTGQLNGPLPDPATPAGRGLWLVGQLCEDVHVVTGATGTVITFALNGAISAAGSAA